MNFLKRLLRQTCTHRFAWPRSDDHGGHYQTCLACGTVFEYDWIAMRRTGRKVIAVIPPSRDLNFRPTTH